MEIEFNDTSRDDHSLVLVIDHDHASAEAVIQQLQNAGYRAAWADNAAAGMLMIERFRPNAVVLDMNLADMSGLALCKEIKERMMSADTPVLFLSSSPRSDDLIQHCFDAGGHDVLIKPVSRVELLGRIRVVLQEQALRDAYRRLAVLDQLTGLANRHQFFLYLTDAVMASKRAKTDSFLILADIDNLALVNEKYGHEFGDEVVLTFARLIKRVQSPTCRAGRIGGEEFAIVLTDSTPERAVALAERLRQTFASIAFDARSQPKHFYAGFGVAHYDGHDPAFNADTFMLKSDIALFVAKEVPRGRVVSYWSLDPNSLPVVAPHKRHARIRQRRRTQRSFLSAPGADGAEFPSITPTQP
ncbi:MAG: diguanylate cyclase [Planctomycetes bacterium]|nr:diguanylate cyclase [Planctomycetota bacterium]